MIGEPIISVIMATIALSTVFSAPMKWIFGVNCSRSRASSKRRTSTSWDCRTYCVSDVDRPCWIGSAMMVGTAWFFRLSKYGLAMRAIVPFTRAGGAVARHIREERVCDGLAIPRPSRLSPAWRWLVQRRVLLDCPPTRVKVFPAATRWSPQRRRGAGRHHHWPSGKLRAFPRQRISAHGQSRTRSRRSMRSSLS